jgi:hypothetical protein
MIDHTVRRILKYKAESLKSSPEYSAYVEKVLKELEIKDAKEAAIVGAIDAMIHGATSAMDSTGVEKKSLLEEILKK